MGDVQKRVFLTGASSGIGLAAAAMLSARGYFVVGTARDPDRVRAGLESRLGGRLPLVGESVAHYKNGAVRCELCRSLHHREQPVSETLVKHAPDGPHSRVRVIRRLPS